MRILALDWGHVRVGVAISDETQTIATAFEKILNAKTAIEEIKQIVNQFDIGLILIGLPATLKGKEGHSAESVKNFGQRIHNETGKPTQYLDERFSSIAAGKALSEQGLSEKKQRAIKDNIAAQLMLQQYLDRKK